MERCPNCRARLRDEPQCRRCGMDLEPLWAAEAGAAAWLRQALALLTGGRDEEAGQALRQSLRLCHDPLAAQLLDLLAHEAKGHDKSV